MDQADDPTQFAFAVKHGRTVVTNNFRDFVALDEALRNYLKILDQAQ